MRLLGVHRGVVLLRAGGGQSRGWAHSGVSISVVTTERRRTASSAVVGVIRSRRRQRRGNGLSRTAARRRRHIGGRFAQHSFAELGNVNVIARFDRRAGPHRFGPSSRSPSRRFAGDSPRHRPRERFVWRGAHSSGGITSGCTRRRRASVGHMQAAVNRGRRRHHRGPGFTNHRVHSRPSACLEALCSWSG